MRRAWSSSNSPDSSMEKLLSTSVIVTPIGGHRYRSPTEDVRSDRKVLTRIPVLIRHVCLPCCYVEHTTVDGSSRQP